MATPPVPAVSTVATVPPTELPKLPQTQMDGDLKRILGELRLPEYVRAALVSHDVLSMDVFMQLNEQYLKDMNIKIGSRIKILGKIREGQLGSLNRPSQVEQAVQKALLDLERARAPLHPMIKKKRRKRLGKVQDAVDIVAAVHVKDARDTKARCNKQGCMPRFSYWLWSTFLQRHFPERLQNWLDLPLKVASGPHSLGLLVNLFYSDNDADVEPHLTAVTNTKFRRKGSAREALVECLDSVAKQLGITNEQALGLLDTAADRLAKVLDRISARSALPTLQPAVAHEVERRLLRLPGPAEPLVPPVHLRGVPSVLLSASFESEAADGGDNVDKPPVLVRGVVPPRVPIRPPPATEVRPPPAPPSVSLQGVPQGKRKAGDVDGQPIAKRPKLENGL